MSCTSATEQPGLTMIVTWPSASISAPRRPNARCHEAAAGRDSRQPGRQVSHAVEWNRTPSLLHVSDGRGTNGADEPVSLLTKRTDRCTIQNVLYVPQESLRRTMCSVRRWPMQE
jgi:hypothetical protein